MQVPLQIAECVPFVAALVQPPDIVRAGVTARLGGAFLRRGDLSLAFTFTYATWAAKSWVAA